MDDISGIGQGVRGADVHQVVVDARGVKRGAILWECKNARNWSDGWIAKLKADQRSLHADVAVLVTAALPKDCRRFTMIDGVLVTDFACAGALAAVLRANLLELAQARNAALHKHDTLELLLRYLSGVEFRQRVEAIVEAFTAMRADLDQERRAAERAWARRAKQIDAVTFNVSGCMATCRGWCRRCRGFARSNCRPRTSTQRRDQGPEVTTMARHARAPWRRYACGRLASKYIESPAPSACSSPSTWTHSVPASA